MKTYFTYLAALVALVTVSVKQNPAKAGPVCRNAFPQASMSVARISLRPDLIVGYDFFAKLQACEYGSGHLTTCELRANNIRVERFFSYNPPDGNEHYRTWNFPQMAKGGFAKGHDCNDLVHDNEDGKWAVVIANYLVAKVMPSDKPEIDTIASTYPPKS